VKTAGYTRCSSANLSRRWISAFISLCFAYFAMTRPSPPSCTVRVSSLYQGAGTYASAATKLADLAQLGINMVEILPVNEFPGSYSWGYNPTYPFAPCRAYGSPDDFKSFVEQAHQLGIGVILDVVFNHFSLDSRTAPSLSMWCFDGECDGGGVYFSPEPQTPWGPRPAFGTPEVHDLIIDAVKSWVSDYHVDGFRWDSVIAIRNQSLDGSGTEIVEGARLLRDANVALHQLAPKVITIAEDLQGWSAITTPVDPSTIDQYGSGYGFDSQWDDNFFYTLTPLITAATDAERDVTTLVGPLTSGPPMQRVVYTEDHDKVAPQNGPQYQRIPELVGMSDRAYWALRRSGLGLAIVLTAPATPMLFMGQEFLETLPFPFSPAAAMDWNNEQTYSGFRTMVHDLIALRKNSNHHTAGLTGGNIQVIQAVNSPSPAIAYHRWANGGPGDDVVVAANFSDAQLALSIGLPEPGIWHVRFNSDDTIYSSSFSGTPSDDVPANGPAQDGQPQSGTVNLGPYSVVILGQ
jgi:1,4-alpha-glucan branching enzyme